MRKATLLFLSVTMLFSIGCAAKAKVARTSPRLTGDVFIAKVEPAPSVMATEDGTPEAMMLHAEETYFYGRIWNEMGRCTIEYDLPPNTFQFRSIKSGLCTQNFPDLGVAMQHNQEVEAIRQVSLAVRDSKGVRGYKDFSAPVVYKQTTDEAGNQICEIWMPTNNAIVPPGLITPEMRALGGFTYSLPFTQTSATGNRPYTGMYRLPVVAGLTTMRKGKRIDWGIVAHQCYAR